MKEEVSDNIGSDNSGPAAPSGEPDETDETLANALRKLISHRFKQKIDQSRTQPNRPGLYLAFEK